MALVVGTRPASLDGCWSSWQEQDLDVLVSSEMESGAFKTRRRFTGISRKVTASVILPVALLNDFRNWYRVNQQQGIKGALIKTPEGTEEAFQWVAPPSISVSPNGTFTAQVSMLQGAWM
jgi:hypothetical protein